eukprot:3441817-Rhodomonas_salina.1
MRSRGQEATWREGHVPGSQGYAHTHTRTRAHAHAHTHTHTHTHTTHTRVEVTCGGHVWRSRGGVTWEGVRPEGDSHVEERQ